MSDERNCPECGSTLHLRATYCGCGWGKAKKGARQPEPRRAECAFDLCGRDAIVKLKTSNLCEVHYELIAKRSAEKFCESMGLKTTAERRAWALANNKGLKRFHEAVTHEPEDESIPF